MEVKEQLVRMLRIQELVLEMGRHRALIEGAPARIEEIEGRFRERNAEYVALKTRCEELETDQKSRNGELAELEESKKKYTKDLMQVQNQREYSAILKEIDSVKAKIAEHEDAILKAMEEVESLSPQLESFAAHIQTERTQVEEERAKVEAEAEEGKRLLARCDEERRGISSELPPALTANLHRIEELRQGLFLVKVEDGLCQACYVRVRPQVFQEIKAAARIHTCSQCRRFLYFEPALKQRESRENDASGVEALDGGAV